MSDQETAAIPNAALADEIYVLDSIYGAGVLTVTTPATSASTDLSSTIVSDSGDTIDINSDNEKIILQLPGHPISFLLSFDHNYPCSPPHVKGTQSTGHLGKGSGHQASGILADALAKVWTPGAVCLFDLIEEVRPLLDRLLEEQLKRDDEPYQPETISAATVQAAEASKFGTFEPVWSVSEPVTEKKSVFVARCAPIAQRADVTDSLHQLLSTNRKVAVATHNITAWRIRDRTSNVVAQDCDDDGETAAGVGLLRLMQQMDVWNVVVVVTRWYGGVKLGPGRFRLINQVARAALIKGNFVKTGKPKSGKLGGKK